MARDESGFDRPYILGHSEHELARLRSQARLLEPVTVQYFREAGIQPGMRVLDVGSGAGDVALIAAELVGKGGEVIGTDASPKAVEVATNVVRDHGLRNVQFRCGDPSEMKFDGAFDAVVGRYVLPFQPSPAKMLAALSRHLEEGGLLVFHEPEWGFVRSLPAARLYDRACGWIVETTRKSGQSWSFLDRADPAFREAGLPSPTLRLRTHVSSSPESHPWLMAVGDMVESLLTSIESLGVATAAEVDLPTLRERLWEEAQSAPRVFVGRSEVGIWTTVARAASSGNEPRRTEPS